MIKIVIILQFTPLKYEPYLFEKEIQTPHFKYYYVYHGYVGIAAPRSST